MKKFRIISALLAALMLVGSLTVFEVSAVTMVDEDTYLGKGGVEHEVINYITQTHVTDAEKLATMDIMVDNLHGYRLYADYYSGEVACTNLATGQTVFTNPYNIGDSNGSNSIKEQLMSQVIIRYTDNDQEKYFYSYKESALRGQINVESIKNGVRVEYTIGREETRVLVPRLIRKERFENEIMALIEDDWATMKMSSFYQLLDLKAETSERAAQELQNKFPITKKMAVYCIESTISSNDLRLLENYIKEWCPLFTYEVLEEVHAETEYEGTSRAPALFRLAIEYTLDEHGLQIRVPFNGLRFDESEYQLTDVQILPYLGAGASPNKGFTYFPDGSGTTIRFEDIAKVSSTTLTNKLYGLDYAYHNISGAHFEPMTLPVYGIVENIQKTISKKVDNIEETVDPVTGETIQTVNGTKTVREEYKEDRGIAVLIEEGESLAEISSIHGGSLHMYHSVTTRIVPRPKDSYNLRDAISVGSNATWTVVSERKFVGNYRLRVFMLTDESIAAEKGLGASEYYPATDDGIIHAVRDYWFDTGVLTRLTEEDVKEDIPLYIESFGTLETLEKILSVPVNVMTPLTTFENIKTMYDDLAAEGITNINFRLTGFANGGLYSELPANLKWEKSVGGNKGFEELVAYANEKDFGLFPEFDFSYASSNTLFDALNLKKHAVKTINNQYTMKRYYSATFQAFEAYGEMAISPAYFDYFYTKFNEKYQKYGNTGISVSTLASDLNTDFDEDEPYNREDNKEFTVDMLKKISTDYAEVMADVGNAYALPYVDHLLNVPLDSSRFLKASRAFPGNGMLYHGSINFAGSPINMAGDIRYDMLKAIENGATLYFTLSYDNTNKLKEDFQFSKYYSIRYDIWFEELVELYKELNGATRDLQTKLIMAHDYMIGERVPDADEIEADRLAALEAEAEAQAKADEEARKAAMKEERERRKAEELGEAYVPSLPEEEFPEEPTGSKEEEGYQYTKYTSDDGSIVKVTYEGGVVFYLNYNNFAVTVEDEGQTYTLDAYGYVRVN